MASIIEFILSICLYPVTSLGEYVVPVVYGLWNEVQHNTLIWFYVAFIAALFVIVFIFKKVDEVILKGSGNSQSKKDSDQIGQQGYGVVDPAKDDESAYRSDNDYDCEEITQVKEIDKDTPENTTELGETTVKSLVSVQEEDVECDEARIQSVLDAFRNINEPDRTDEPGGCECMVMDILTDKRVWVGAALVGGLIYAYKKYS